MATKYYEIRSTNSAGFAGSEFASSKRGALEVARWLRTNGYTGVTIAKVA